MCIPDSGINYIEDSFWAYLWQVTLEYHRWTLGIRMSPWRQPFLHGMCLGLISPCKSSDGWLVNFFIWTLCTLIIVDSCICNGKPSPWMGHLVTTTCQVPYTTPASFWILHYDVSQLPLPILAWDVMISCTHLIQFPPLLIICAFLISCLWPVNHKPFII